MIEHGNTERVKKRGNKNDDRDKRTEGKEIV